MAKRLKVGIQVAKAIISGDYSYARNLAARSAFTGSWTVAECRAIFGASRYVNEKFGWPNIAKELW